MFAHTSSLPDRSCSVCDSTDARTLSTTALASGAIVVVCGSHEVAHSRASRPARTVRELRAVLGDRRERRDRRDLSPAETDALAQALAAAFSAERRARGRRRADP
jgi:hypothetical protein